MNLLPILTGQIKARACDWAVEGKAGQEVLKKREKEEDGGWREKKMGEEELEDGAAPHGLAEPQIARDFIAGQ